MSALESLLKASSNLNCRDKSVKILQYGARVILGYYGSILQPESINNIQSILSTCILGRRSFRLLRSVHHIQLLVMKLNRLSKTQFFITMQHQTYLIECIEAFEQLCWTLFFLFDNIILGIRMRMLNLDLKQFESLFFPCWFAADVSMFLKTSISLHKNMQARRTFKASQFNGEYYCLHSEGIQNMRKNVTFNPPTSTTTWGGEAVTSVSSRANDDADLVSEFPISSSSSVVCSISDGTMDIGSTRDITDINFDNANYRKDANHKVPNLSDNENSFNDKIKDLTSNQVKTSDMSPASKRKFNIRDFQNTTIEKVLSENSNISKILSGEGSGSADAIGNVGVYGVSCMCNGNGDGANEGIRSVDGTEAVSSISPGRDEYVLSGYHRVNGAEDAVVSKVENEVTDADNGAGLENSSNHTSDALCSDDVSDPDVNIPDKMCENSWETEVSTTEREGNTSDKMTVLEKEQTQLYWKLLKSVVDMGVSGSFNPQLPIKRVLGEGTVGVLGIISASMAIYEEVQK